MTTVVCNSDFHEHLLDIPTCDRLLIAGDVSFAFNGDIASEQSFLAGESKHWAGPGARRMKSCSSSASMKRRGRLGHSGWAAVQPP
jgi:hypothetical protein